MILCEKVTVDYATDQEESYLVKYDDEKDAQERDSALAYLRDCGHEIDRQTYPLADLDTGEGISWGEFSDLIEPGDR